MSSPRLIAKSVNYQPNYLKCTIDVVGGRGWSTPPQATETVPSFQLMAQAPGATLEKGAQHPQLSVDCDTLHAAWAVSLVSDPEPSTCRTFRFVPNPGAGFEKSAYLFCSFCNVETFTIRKYFRMLHNLIDP